jgi:hypothetical protein
MDGDWRVSWSHQLEGRVGAVCALSDGIIVACGGVVRLISDLGDFVWKRTFQFDVYRLVADSTNVAVLSGPGFHLLSLATGDPLGEGRAVSGGFRDVLSRPGGGWVLPDRGDHVHLFNNEGRGIRRLRPGRIRKLVGWLDREHLLAMDDDGHLRCLRLFGEDSQRIIEERRWAWASRLSSGRMLVQAMDGSIFEGVPNPFGWDSLEQLVSTGVDPLEAVRTGDGWWMLTMDGSLDRIPPSEGDALPAGVILASNDADVMASSTRDGLLRWWESPRLISRRSELLRKLVSEERRRVDWEQRQVIFEAARDAEDNGLLTRAVELYGTLGRSEDVHRLLAIKERGG